MRRKCKLANTSFKDIDLRNFEQIIVDTINSTVTDKNPMVFKDYFSTDSLTQSESVAIGRALSKIAELNVYGKSIITFRLFDGKNYANEQSTLPIKKQSTPKGGRKR